MNSNKGLNLRLWLPLIVGVSYGLFYLYAIGDLTMYGPPAWGAFLTEPTLERALTARATLMFEAIGVIEMGWLVWLISPLNLFLTLLLSGLLAANIHGVLYLRSQPASCHPASSLAGALPALFAGGACCAPSLILLLGIPGLGAFTAMFGWLMPVSVLALGLSRIWQHHLGAPPMFRILKFRSTQTTRQS